MIKRLTQREQKIFFLCVFICAVFVGYNGVVKPLKSRINLIDKKIRSGKRDYAKGQRLLRKEKKVSSLYQSYADQYKQEMPNEQVMSSMLSEIEKVAEEYQLRISQMKPQKVQKETFTNRFSLSLTIDSPFIETMRFLYVLQSEPHIFEVESITLDRGVNKRSDLVKTRLVLSKVYIP